MRTLPVSKAAVLLYYKPSDLSEAEVAAKDLIDMLHTDHPAWRSRQLSCRLNSYTNRYLHASTVYRIQFDYGSDIDKLKKYHIEAKEKAQRIISSTITEYMYDFGKIKAIHDYIILNCEYDYENCLNGTLPYETWPAYETLCNRKARFPTGIFA